MCGISGIFHTHDVPVDPAEVLAMADRLHHRGPDDRGYLFAAPGSHRIAEALPAADPDWRLGLAHNRLSIIDLSSAGHQPMCNEDGTLWLIFNGEIYNYIELRKELEHFGHQFKSNTDSEVILHGWEQWGSGCLERFNGMWALVLYDRRTHSLFCARDRYGIKPFYYFHTPGRFCFASELKALLQLPDLPIEYDYAKILRYIVWGLMDEDGQTMLAPVKRLQPGEALTVTRDGLAFERYYDLRDRLSLQSASFEDNADRFLELFQDSVRLRLRSDVPLGTCLSGGLDSSAIVDQIARLGGASSPLMTFSAVFEGEAVDESPHVRTMVDHVGADAHYTTPTAPDLLADLDDLIVCQDEPFWSTTAYNHFRVMKLAKSGGVKVLLDGQGGDELLGGYTFYFVEFLLHLVQRGKWSGFLRELSALKREHGYRARSLLPQMFALAVPPAWRFRMQRHLNFAEKAVINRDLIDGAGFFKRYDALTNDRIQTRNYWDFQYSIPYLLRLEDRNSMAFSLESRVPFLDYRLVDFLFGVPAEQKIAAGMNKALLRHALRGRVPDAILGRRDKIGFFTPEARWMRNELRPAFEETLNSRQVRERGIFDTSAVQKHLRAFMAGKSGRSHVIWRWFNLEKWFQSVESRFDPGRKHKELQVPA